MTSSGAVWGGCWRLVPLAAIVLGACANPPATLVILQDQKTVVDMTTNACVVSTDPTDPRFYGIFDVYLDQPYPYYVYPLVQNRLPSLMTLPGVEQNSVQLTAVRVDIKAPAGVEPGWPDGCPATFDWPTAALLDPTQTQSLVAEGFQTCHAKQLKALIADGSISGDASQPVFFTLDLTVVANHAGSNLPSDPFPFQVQVCAGCLQSMFPKTPLCSDSPRPNPYHGNPCNIAQDEGPVLCCFDANMALVCPAPDQ